MGHNKFVNGEAPVSTEIQSTKQAISCRDLTLTFLKLGSIGFGGGMAMIALMEHEFVGKRQIIEV